METKTWILLIIIVVFGILFGIFYYKANKLADEKYELMKHDYIEQIDSLNRINKNYLNTIDSLALNITDLNNQIEYLNRDKEELEDKIHDFTISSNLSEGVELLRQNICSH